MVGRLRPEFHLAEPAVRISGCFADRLFKELGVHEVGAGAGDEIAAVLHQLHSAEVDLAVAPRCRFDGIAGFGEGRRIQDDHIVLLTLFDEFGQQGEYVAAQE